MSGQCLDMITRMLVVEPQKRISMSDIKGHPFFRRGLPAGALDMNNRLLQSQAFTPGVGSRMQLHPLANITNIHTKAVFARLGNFKNWLDAT